MDCWTAAVLIALIALPILGLILLCGWCCWLLHVDNSIGELIREVLQAVGACVKVIVDAMGASVKVIVEAVAPGPRVVVALVLVLLVIAFSFDGLTFQEEVIIGIGFGGFLVLVYLLGPPWRQ